MPGSRLSESQRGFKHQPGWRMESRWSYIVIGVSRSAGGPAEMKRSALRIVRLEPGNGSQRGVRQDGLSAPMRVVPQAVGGSKRFYLTK